MPLLLADSRGGVMIKYRFSVKFFPMKYSENKNVNPQTEKRVQTEFRAKLTYGRGSIF